MRTIQGLIFASLVISMGCDETMQSNYHDLGIAPFKHIGEACQPDVPPSSECGYAPQFYCSASGVCASACNRNGDCPDGSACVGAGDMSVGECRQVTTVIDGGHD